MLASTSPRSIAGGETRPLLLSLLLFRHPNAQSPDALLLEVAAGQWLLSPEVAREGYDQVGDTQGVWKSCGERWQSVSSGGFAENESWQEICLVVLELILGPAQLTLTP